MIVAFLHVTRWFLWVFFNLEKVTVVVMTTEVLEDGFWKPLWVHGAAGPSGVLCVWAET